MRRRATRDYPAAIEKRARVEHLFALYEKLAAPLIAASRAKRKRR